MRTPEQQVASAAEVQKFAEGAIEQYDHLILDAANAKRAMVLNILNGGNAVFVGEPGGGKTTLAKNAHAVVDGIDNLAVIPPESDLKPRQIVGGESVIERQTDGVVQTIKTESDGIINADTQVIFADEFNRGAPHAINGTLSVLENRELVNTAGSIKLDGIEYAVSTMNPGGLAEGVFKINPAIASRHSVGVLMDIEGNDEAQQKIVERILGGWRSAPNEIQTVTDLDTLHAMRRYISPDNIALPQSVRQYAADQVMRSRDVLKEMGVAEALPRLTIHVGKNALTLAAMEGETSVGESHIDDAVDFVVGARIGMRSARPSQDIPKVLDKISR